MFDAVIAQEAPLRTHILAQRVARAHGWLRTGARIRERIEQHLRDADKTMESSGESIWSKGSVAAVVDYRPPADEDNRRSVADISLAELPLSCSHIRTFLINPIRHTISHVFSDWSDWRHLPVPASMKRLPTLVYISRDERAYFSLHIPVEGSRTASVSLHHADDKIPVSRSQIFRRQGPPRRIPGQD
ncbi:DUF3320 domain-containing protein [Zhengella mangrovi]|uniref:DUF3320 domain-containing protein n=1 Tax=Zhengella mangrovi TaxID=1982044 RepID=UPI00315AB01F